MKLLSKASLDVACCASKQSQRPVLNGVFIKSDRVVATDSYRLLEVMHPEEDINEYPTLQGIDLSGPDVEKILPLSALKKAASNIPKSPQLPILEHVAVSLPEEGQASFSTTDLETIDTVRTRFIDGRFPDYQNIMPKKSEKPQSLIRLDANYLMEMAAYFKKHEVNGDILLELRGEEKPALFRGKTESGQVITGLVMPRKLNRE